MNHTEHLTEPWTRIHLYFDTSSLFFKTRREKTEASHILLLTMACQTDPNLWATVGPVAQAIFKCPRTHKTQCSNTLCWKHAFHVSEYICIFLSVCHGRQLPISPTCLHFSLPVWSACSFTAHGFLDSLLYSTLWNWTSLSCFSLSLYCFFSSILCTVPQIPTEFDHLLPVVMAIIICIVVAKLIYNELLTITVVHTALGQECLELSQAASENWCLKWKGRQWKQ